MIITWARVLEIIRAHPEGITTADIVEVLGVGPAEPSAVYMRSKVANRCVVLQKYGLVRKELTQKASRGDQWFSTWYPEAVE